MAKERILEYSVFLEPGEVSGYIARVPAIPGCVTEGRTIEEALAMAKDAAEGMIVSFLKHGDPIPTETKDQIRKIRFDQPVGA